MERRSGGTVRSQDSKKIVQARETKEVQGTSGWLHQLQQFLRLMISDVQHRQRESHE